VAVIVGWQCRRERHPILRLDIIVGEHGDGEHAIDILEDGLQGWCSLGSTRNRSRSHSTTASPPTRMGLMASGVSWATTFMAQVLSLSDAGVSGACEGRETRDGEDASTVLKI
jgi:hypothetical protein